MGSTRPSLEFRGARATLIVQPVLRRHHRVMSSASVIATCPALRLLTCHSSRSILHSFVRPLVSTVNVQKLFRARHAHQKLANCLCEGHHVFCCRQPLTKAPQLQGVRRSQRRATNIQTLRKPKFILAFRPTNYCEKSNETCSACAQRMRERLQSVSVINIEKVGVSHSDHVRSTDKKGD